MLFTGWDVEKGAPADSLAIKPHAIISLTAPKLCLKSWTGPHYVGGRFVPPTMVQERQLRLPDYPGADQIVKVE